MIAGVTAGLLLLPAVLLYGHTHQGDLTQAANQAAQDRITPYAAPSFTAQTMSGKSVQLAQYRGEPVVVSFFAAWCQPCIKDAPAVAKLAADYRGRVQVLSVARASSRDGAERFIHDNGITWPVLWDGSDALTYDFRIFGQPAAFVIDQQGRVVDAQIGAVPQRFHETLDRLLAG